MILKQKLWLHPKSHKQAQTDMAMIMLHMFLYVAHSRKAFWAVFTRKLFGIGIQDMRWWSCWSIWVFSILDREEFFHMSIRSLTNKPNPIWPWSCFTCSFRSFIREKLHMETVSLYGPFQHVLEPRISNNKSHYKIIGSVLIYKAKKKESFARFLKSLFLILAHF